MMKNGTAVKLHTLAITSRTFFPKAAGTTLRAVYLREETIIHELCKSKQCSFSKRQKYTQWVKTKHCWQFC